MACGRPKNLEIAGGNLLCDRTVRRRNFFTTGNGSKAKGKPRATRPGGNPRPSAQRKLRVTGKGATPSHRRRADSAPPGEGHSGPLARKARNHRLRDDLGPLARGHLRPPATGETPEPPATGETPEPSVRGGLGPLARGHPEPPGAGERSGSLTWGRTLSHPARRNLEASVRGQPRAFAKEKTPTHRRRGSEPLPRGRPRGHRQGTPSHPARGNPEPPGSGRPEPRQLLGPVGGRAAQRTPSNRRDGVARLGEAPPSHTWRGLVLLCPTSQNQARTDTPPASAIPAAA
jgi:hypothetical protein